MCRTVILLNETLLNLIISVALRVCNKFIELFRLYTT